MSSQSQENSIKNSDRLLLISATYDSRKKAAVLKFYDSVTQEIILWADKTGHKPYCFSKLSLDEIPPNISERDDVIEVKQVELLDNLEDKMIKVSKIIVKDPLAIGGTQTNKSIRNLIDTWESDIKYYESYLYDNSLIVGKYYRIENDRIIPDDMEISDETRLSLKSMLLDKLGSNNLPDSKQFDVHVSQWAELLNQPIPQIKRISVDIEVDSDTGRIPDPKIAEKRITAIGFEASDGLKQVFVLRRSDVQEGVNELLSGVEIIFYDETKEKEMILDAFELVQKYPLLITYNGDGFDLPYLYNRADKLGIEREKNPFYMMRDSATLRKGVHLDLYRTMSNRAFQIYVFGQKYTDFSLNSVANGVLNEKKIDYGIELNDLSLYQTAKYCQNDARLTYNLTSFNNDLLMNLLIVISRIARMPIDDISRMGVSQWIRSLLYYEHRQNGILIPKRDELEKRSSKVANESIIKDKKFRGGLVIEPKEGVHFDVTVMDFASLYPSIIKVKNLSYETVRCTHDECKKNTVPQTNHWVCTKKNGLTSVIIGSLRDLRVNYYKTMGKKSSLTDEERQLFTVVSQALKVILNASYGVMGAEIFPLYFLPAAEATTAVGRHIILDTIDMCEKVGINVLYGDTDSLFVKNLSQQQIQEIIAKAKSKHNVELEVDKEYRYVVLSNRKKNYLGVTKNGKVDVKGLTGKKSHTPKFIKALFFEILDVLSEVKSVEEFNDAKNRVSDKISNCARKIRAREVPLTELAFNVMTSKAPHEYTKTIPQHIRAALQLQTIREIKRGDIISYVKILNKPGVKPVELAKQSEIDAGKYMEFMQSTLDQITSSMNLDFDSILGKPKQTGLDQFFWN